MRKAILTILEKSAVPLTTSALSRFVLEEFNTRASWNTTQKYIRELVETNQVQPIALPHSKKSGETGLVVYTLKK
jgi:hypothetical protein